MLRECVKLTENKLSSPLALDPALEDPSFAPASISTSPGDCSSDAAGPIVCDFARHATHLNLFFFPSPSVSEFSSTLAPRMTVPRWSLQSPQPHGDSWQNVGLKQFQTAQGLGATRSSGVG